MLIGDNVIPRFIVINLFLLSYNPVVCNLLQSLLSVHLHQSFSKRFSIVPILRSQETFRCLYVRSDFRSPLTLTEASWLFCVKVFSFVYVPIPKSLQKILFSQRFSSLFSCLIWRPFCDHKVYLSFSNGRKWKLLFFENRTNSIFEWFFLRKCWLKFGS